MRTVVKLGVLAAGWLSSGVAPAEEPKRFAERTPSIRIPLEHTDQRAGHSQSVAWWARPSVGQHEAGGYVGGGSLKGNAVFSKSAVATGPTDVGTFGWDYVGPGHRTGRIFLSAVPPKHQAADYYRGYRTDGPRVPDVVSLHPVRKAVLEAREDAHAEK